MVRERCFISQHKLEAAGVIRFLCLRQVEGKTILKGKLGVELFNTFIITEEEKIHNVIKKIVLTPKKTFQVMEFGLKRVVVFICFLLKIRFCFWLENCIFVTWSQGILPLLDEFFPFFILICRWKTRSLKDGICWFWNFTFTVNSLLWSTKLRHTRLVKLHLFLQLFLCTLFNLSIWIRIKMLIKSFREKINYFNNILNS